MNDPNQVTVQVGEFEQVHYEVPPPSAVSDGIHWVEVRGGKEMRSGYSPTWPVVEPPSA